MGLTVLGLVVAFVVSCIGILSDKPKTPMKAFLVALALTGGVVAGISSHFDSVDKAKADAKVDDANKKLAVADAQLLAQKPILDLIDATVGDLGTLNRLSAGEKYYVRISAGSKASMEQYLTGIETNFKGARSSELVSVRPLRKDCPPDDAKVSCWALVFGSNLNPAAAEVFERFADENNFPPAKQSAQMKVQPKEWSTP
jgi:hypothetical protein